MLDPARSYFTAADIAQFDRWQKNSTTCSRAAIWNPASSSTAPTCSVPKSVSTVDALLAEGVDKIDFSLDESLLVDREKAPWAKNQAELDDLWRKRVKDEVLRLKLAGKDSKDIQSLLQKRYKNQRKRLEQTRGEDVFQAYINAFAQTYDPHTNYLSPDNAENFDINMSLSLEGIGAVLQTDNEYVKVVRLVPAGPAEKSS